MTAGVRFEPSRGLEVAPPPLAPDEIHLWVASLDLSPPRVAALASLLSQDEQQRARRYRFLRHRRRFEVTWGLARSLLASYLEEAPAAVRLSYGPKGKPVVTHPESRLEFNLSHSAETVVLAFRREHALGVDIERLRPLGDAGDIARRFFSANEVRSLEALPEASRLAGFFNCWTRKEALIKAVGEGVFVSLNRFDVSLAPDEPARLVTLDGQTTGTDSWQLIHLQPGADVVGALATNRAAETIRAWKLDLEHQHLPRVD